MATGQLTVPRDAGLVDTVFAVLKGNRSYRKFSVCGTDPRSGRNLAKIRATMGGTDEAMAWLERAYEDHDQWMVYLKAYPGWDALRSEPRFQALVRRMMAVAKARTEPCNSFYASLADAAKDGAITRGWDSRRVPAS